MAIPLYQKVLLVVREGGLEPPHPKVLDPKSSASAKFRHSRIRLATPQIVDECTPQANRFARGFQEDLVPRA